MDGNFSAEHMAMRRPEEDVPLNDGAAFMVGTADYKAHLAVAIEDKLVSGLRGQRLLTDPRPAVAMQ
jgi:hypothetical protein